MVTTLLAGSAAAAPGPGEQQSVGQLLTQLQKLYRQAEQASETYNATEVALKKKRGEATLLGKDLSKARKQLTESRAAAGRLARRQYQGASELSPYVRLLLARDPQSALDQGHVVRRLADQRTKAIGRLADGEKQAASLATRSRAALKKQTALADRQKKQRDTVKKRLAEVEELLAGLSADELAELGRLETAGAEKAQKSLLASGALGAPGSPGSPAATRAPSSAGNKALRYAVRQIGKPYVWGAEGPKAYDCSGLTSQAWANAGDTIPRTSQEQWKELPKVPLKSLRPGDLVVYFPDATHVALYLGDGLVVQAPRPGTKVKVSPIAANPLLGAVRPDPGAPAVDDYSPPKLPKGARNGSDSGYGSASAPAGSAEPAA
ncbi:C40 family peptidase [Streptomyces sp. YIM 130001]|uniref:C40 family peptidase n=1 Tax=Streptomyces sp. YIM 130001 TaxID=2259644 RepID=UPI001F090A4E|nr:C40 family peptidase [Streptomyces sp. YIM 130001]